MGGENRRKEAHVQGPVGPSPRGWGERHLHRMTQGEARTIPTWVGRTQSAELASTKLADHPHVGGENVGTASGESYAIGPSPRGWGEREALDRVNQGDRTIPTWVGRTVPDGCGIPRRPDHPHVGGENAWIRVSRPPLIGPSPRGWGERSQPARSPDPLRTIPTWVGRTPSASPAPGGRSDHPHVGGENFAPRAHSRGRSGPSPRGWGEQAQGCYAKSGPRTIPTWVGRTRPPRPPPSTAADHPHVGGENSAATGATPTLAGPSPRGWGEHLRMKVFRVL